MILIDLLHAPLFLNEAGKQISMLSNISVIRI